MRQIYKQSKKTLVWLGPETGDTAKAFELIPYLLKVFCEAFHGKPRPIRLDRRLLKHPSILQVYQQVRCIEPFVQLEQRPYFSRIWILQELAVSYNKSTFLCGQFSLSWADYVAAAFTFACFEIQKADIHKPLGAFLEVVAPALQVKTSETTTLISLLDRYRQQESTDPRDKISALLGIAGSKDISFLGCKVDYTSDVVEVYTNLARSYIQRDDNIDILGYVQCGSIIPYLLSWVPYWTKQRDIPINFRSPNISGICFNHHAGGEKGCGGAIDTLLDGRTLRSYGIIFDKIARISGLIDEAWSGGCCNAHTWETIAELSERIIYVAGDTAVDAFFLTQLAVCPKPVYDTVKGRIQELWEEAKKHLRQETIHGSFAMSTANGSQQKQINLMPVSERETRDVEALLSSSLRYTKRRRFATTYKGYFALVPAETSPGDHVVILKGGSWPFGICLPCSRTKLEIGRRMLCTWNHEWRGF